jgi:hypothetical protein
MHPRCNPPDDKKEEGAISLSHPLLARYLAVSSRCEMSIREPLRKGGAGFDGLFHIESKALKELISHL